MDVLQKYYGINLQNIISNWVQNLDEMSFEQESIGDDLSHFSNLFTTMEDIFDKFVKKQSNNHIRCDQDLLQIKLLFVAKLLKCNKMDKRVQSLSLMKIVLEKARSDDNKYKNNNETNEWSTKHKHHHYHKHNNNNNNNDTFMTLRDRCSDFIIKQQILNLLMSPSYIHENLLQRLQPIIDVLCETSKMTISIIRLLWNASSDKHSIELTQFDKLYLSLSKQLPSNLCRQFYDDIMDERYEYLRLRGLIEQSHLEFIAQFTSNYIDQSKSSSSYKNFKGIRFLKNYAIHFNDNIVSNICLRKSAFKKIEIILQKHSMKNNIKLFLTETLKNMSQYIHPMNSFDDDQSYFNRKEHVTLTGVDPIDLTYCIEGMDQLFKTKHIGKTNEQIYSEIAEICMNEKTISSKSMIDLMVREIQYWYWYCSPIGFDNVKKWKIQKKRDLKIRFDFIKIIAQKTDYVVTDDHVKLLTKIPNLNKKFYNSTCSDIYISKLNEIHSHQLKSWLNDCVKLNKAVSILDKNAIQSIFINQFDPNMDYNGYKSWLAYFHDLNGDYYNIQTNTYNFYKDIRLEAITGDKHIWEVIENSSNKQVVIEMIDELIRLCHAMNYNTLPYCIHIEISGGINKLFKKCNQKFVEYIKKKK